MDETTATRGAILPKERALVLVRLDGSPTLEGAIYRGQRLKRWYFHHGVRGYIYRIATHDNATANDSVRTICLPIYLANPATQLLKEVHGDSLTAFMSVDHDPQVSEKSGAEERTVEV